MLAALSGADAGDRASVDIKASRYQKSGLLWKLPMSKPSSEKWQKRLCVAKDGWLLYYGPTEDVSKNFSTKPKGILPLGGSKVDTVERGPKGGKFGIKVTHPDFYSGRALILSAESEEAQKQWLQALQDCSRVTMENALLGDSMIEKLRAHGTTAEKEKEDAMLKLQEQAMALARETEEKLQILSGQEAVLKEASVIEERAKAKEAEVSAALQEMERRRADLEVQAAGIQAEVDARSSALAGANDEYAKLMTLLAAAKAAPPAPAPSAVAAPAPAPAAAAPSSASSSSASSSAASSSLPPPPPPASAAAAPAYAAQTGATMTALPPPPSSSAAFAPMSPASTAAAVHRAEAFGVAGMSRGDIAAIEARARQLEEDKLRLEQEKKALERSVKDMTATTANLQSSLHSAEEVRRQLQEQMTVLSSEETDLMQERALRKRLERKLQIAEESLKRLDGALRRSGVKLDVDVFADVRTLMAFFEERIDEAKRDAHRIEIMKTALAAKKRYLVASGGNDGSAGAGQEDEEGGDERDSWDDAPAPAPAPAPAAAARPVQPAAAVPPPPPPPPPARAAADDRADEEWSDNERDNDSRDASSVAQEASFVTSDDLGPLPAGWTLQTDDEGDKWYYHVETQETSWERPT